MSLESLRFMLGGAIHRSTTAGEKVIVRHTEEVVVESDGKVPLPKDHLTGRTLTPKAYADRPIRLINLTTGARTQLQVGELTNGVYDTPKKIVFHNPAMLGGTDVESAANDHIRMFWEEELTSTRDDETAIEVTISPSTFPGTYKVVGDTFMRSEKTGKDEPFQFIIGKAKVSSEVTITLEAEGDPSTFEMTLNVLRSTNDRGENEMMKLVRYSFDEGESGSSGNDNGSLGA